MALSHRVERIQEQVREEVSQMLATEVRDPGVGLIWIAYVSLIIGLVLTFYFPRRRVWARQHADHLELAFIGDRYVSSEREFGALLDDLSARLRNLPERRLQPVSGGGPA